MGLLSKLKSLLGADDDDSRGRDGVDVTVERGADSGSGRTDDGVAASDTTEPADDVAAGRDEAMESEPAEEESASDADAAASTESLVDETHTDDPSRAAEPGEAADPTGDDPAASEPDGEEAEPDAGEVETEAGEAESDVEEAESDVEDGESASVVKGIGPAYADRLADVGVETVADLAAADPADLAEQIDLSEKRVARWVERANDRQ